MARLATTIAFDKTSDTTWRAMWSAIDAAILSMGWSRTTDTGQVDTATVTAPTGTDQIRGYALYKATDSLAATKPMIFRLQLGTGGDANRIRVNFKVGHTTDGAGNFSGITNSWDRGNSDFITMGTTAWECYFSGDTNRIAVALADNQTAQPSNLAYFSVERSHDNTGADTDLGIWGTYSQGLVANYHNFIPYVGVMQGQQTTLVGPVPNTTTLIGTNIGLFSTHPIYVVALSPSTQWLHYIPGEISSNTIITVNMYGATRTFLTMRHARGNRDAHLMALRWDT